MNSRKILTGSVLAVASGVLAVTPQAVAAEEMPSVDLITPALLQDAEDLLNSRVVHEAINAENRKREGLSQNEIDELDQAWRSETNQSGAQPFIAAALGSPASTYLLRAQAASKGMYYEIFVMDEHGLNVAQSSVTSDFWQGDEAKFLNTFPDGAGAVFIDTPEYNADLGIWAVQVNLTIDDNNQPIGVGTVEYNLTELARRQALREGN